MIKHSLPMSTIELAPHRPPMLLTDKLIEFIPGQFAKGSALISADNPFLNKAGILDRSCLVEMMAQIIASGSAYDAMNTEQTSKSGLLVGVDDFHFSGDAKAGDYLSIEMEQKTRIGDFSIMEGKIFKGSECIAHGGLKFFETEETFQGGRRASDESRSIKKTRIPGSPPADKSPVCQSLAKSLMNFEETSAGKAAWGTFCIDADFPGFQGHFPELAILPGVVMIEMLMLLYGILCKTPLKINSIKKAKFTNLVFPGELTKLEISVDEKDKVFRVVAKLSVGKEKVATFIIT